MIRLFLSLTIISIVIVSIWSSDGYTVHSSLLTDHVFKTVASIDWLQCVEECHKHDECISYNYFPPKKICELNNFGYDNQCEAGNNLIRATGWIHHVLDISKEMKRKRKAGEVSNGTESPDSFASCRDIYLKTKTQENKAYLLQTDIGGIPVYCRMTGIDECGDGGWTLVMKIDGNKSTFHYDSKLWSNKTEFNLPGGETGFDNQETKLPTYWNTNFSKICLGMKRIGNELAKFLVISKNGTSLYSLISDGHYRPTSLGRDKWKTLIGSEASLQRNCNKEGFNAVGSNEFSKARIGIIRNNEDDCDTCNSRIGFGTGGNYDDNNTCGNEATIKPDNRDKHIKTMGYILVK